MVFITTPPGSNANASHGEATHSQVTRDGRRPSVHDLPRWGAACKGRWGGGAHREWCGVGERGDGERLWVSAWCLSGETRRVSTSTQRDCGGDKSTSQFIKMLTWESQLRVEGSRVHGVRTNFQPISTLMRKLLPVGCIRYSLRMVQDP